MASELIHAARVLAVVLLLVSGVQPAVANDYTYAEIAKRHPQTRLPASVVADAGMQGECLFGLKQLNFRRQDEFDPVAEWTNYRSLSLLEQFPPCTVLIMMEVARASLLAEDAAIRNAGQAP